MKKFLIISLFIFIQIITINTSYAVYENNFIYRPRQNQYYNIKNNYMVPNLIFNNYVFYFNKGNENYTNKNYKEAIKNYSKAIELDAKSVNAYLYRAYSYLQLNNINSAMNDLKQVVKLDPNNYYANQEIQNIINNIFNKANSKYNQKDYNGAINDYTKAMQYTNNKEILYSLYNSRGTAKAFLKDYDNALKDFDNAIKINPNDSLTYKNIAGVKLELKDYQGVIEYSNRAIAIDKKDDMVYYARGLARLELKDYYNAIKDYNMAIGLDSNSPAKEKMQELLFKIAPFSFIILPILLLPIKLNVKQFKKYNNIQIESEFRKRYNDIKENSTQPSPAHFNIKKERINFLEDLYYSIENVQENDLIANCILVLGIAFVLTMFVTDELVSNVIPFMSQIILWSVVIYKPVVYIRTKIIEEQLDDPSCTYDEYNGYLLYKGCLDLYNQKLEDAKKLREEQERLKREAEEKALRQKKSYWQKFWADVQKDGFAFEREIANLYRKLGFHVELTKGTGDGGVDLILLKDGVKSIVQCKAHLQSVGPEPVRALWGVKDDFKADEVILIAYSGVTSGAKDFARKKNYKILDINDIINLCIEVNKI